VIRYGAGLVDGALGDGIEVIGLSEETAAGADVACGDALTVGADDAVLARYVASSRSSLPDQAIYPAVAQEYMGCTAAALSLPRRRPGPPASAV